MLWTHFGLSFPFPLCMTFALCILSLPVSLILSLIIDRLPSPSPFSSLHTLFPLLLSFSHSLSLGDGKAGVKDSLLSLCPRLYLAFSLRAMASSLLSRQLTLSLQQNLRLATPGNAPSRTTDSSLYPYHGTRTGWNPSALTNVGYRNCY